MKRIKFYKILTFILFLIVSNNIIYGGFVDWFKNTADKVGNAFKTAGNAIKDKVIDPAVNAFKKAGNEIANIAKLTGQKIKSCSEVVKLGTEWVAEKSGLTVANGILEGAKKAGQATLDAANKTLDGVKKGGEYAAFVSAQRFLDGTKASSQVFIDAANKTLEGVKKGVDYAAFESAKGALKAAKESAKGVLTLADAFAKGLEKGFNIRCIRLFGGLTKIEFDLDATILGKDINIKSDLNFNDIEKFAEVIFNKLKDEIAKIFH